MKKRIKRIREEAHLTQVEFAKRLGLAGNTITSYEKGVREPSTQVITSICREFSISEDWLRTGTEPMRPDMTRAEQAARIVGNALNTDDDFIINTFIALGQLSPAEWELVKRFVDKIKDSY